MHGAELIQLNAIYCKYINLNNLVNLVMCYVSYLFWHMKDNTVQNFSY